MKISKSHWDWLHAGLVDRALANHSNRGAPPELGYGYGQLGLWDVTRCFVYQNTQHPALAANVYTWGYEIYYKAIPQQKE